MNIRINSNFKHILTRMSAVLLAVLFLPACARKPNQLGSRRSPSNPGSSRWSVTYACRRNPPFPVVLFVHGSGPADRTLFGYYLPVMERMLKSGYAVFSWDKPGYGESTGKLSDARVYHQRAQIILDAIMVMKKHPDIDHQRIGLWGTSQVGM